MRKTVCWLLVATLLAALAVALAWRKGAAPALLSAIAVYLTVLFVEAALFRS